MAVSLGVVDRSAVTAGGTDAAPLGAPRVAFLCHAYHRGGVTKWMRDVAVELARRGWSVDFVTVRPSRPFASGGERPTMADFVPQSSTLRVHAPLVGRAFELGTEAYRASVYESTLVGALVGETPVIVSDDAAAWRAAASTACRYRAIGVLHGDANEYYRLAERYHSAMSALVCVSDRIARAVRDRLGSNAPTVSVIPCGIALRPLRDAGDSGGGTNLIWIGRIEQRAKRVHDLPAILHRLTAMGTHATLTIIGDGPDAPALRQALAGTSGHQVRWLGWLHADQVRNELARADVLLLSSAHEGMPLVVMEALAEGCSVISSRVSGVEDLASDPLASSCLWTFEVGDIEAAAELIRSVGIVPHNVRRTAARTLAERACSLEVCADRYEHLLSTVRPAFGRAGPRSRLAHMTTSVLSLPVALVRLARR